MFAVSISDLARTNSGRGWRNGEPERRVKAVMLDHLLGLSWSARVEEDPRGRSRGGMSYVWAALFTCSMEENPNTIRNAIELVIFNLKK